MLTLNDGRNELWQWDTGRKLTVDADCSQVHFSNKVFGRSIDVDVVDGIAIIPDILLQTDKDLTAWAFVGTAENGYTKISNVFKVNKRNKPADYVFTPIEQTTIDEIAAIAQSVRDDADAGKFDGKDGQDGYTPVKGKDYFDGADGKDGESGVYVGSGEMPEDCNVQIDPDGEVMTIESLAREVAAYIPAADGNAGIWTNKNFVAFGTSITWACRNHGGGFLEIVKNRNGFASFTNNGVSGAAMPSIRSTIRQTDMSKYDLVLLECSTNDFKLNVPLGSVGSMGDTSFDTSTFCGAVRDSIEYILTNKPTMHILLITDTQRNHSGYDVNYTNSAGHKLIDYVDALISIGELYGLPVCDWYRKSGFNALTLSTYTKDGLHPNDAGYNVLGNLTASAVGNMYCYSVASPIPEEEETIIYRGTCTTDIWEDGEVLTVTENPLELNLVSGYAFRSAPLWEGPVVYQENRASSISNVLCGYFEGKTISMSSFTLSDGRQIKFAMQYVALNDDGTFEWTRASDGGGLSFDAWHSEPVRIHGTYDTMKRHLLFMSFMADTLTQEDCEEIKTLIRIT